MEFNQRFQRTLSRIPNNAKPTNAVTLNLYLNSFDPQLNVPLKQKEPTNLQDAMEKDATLESYLDGCDKVNPITAPRAPKAG